MRRIFVSLLVPVTLALALSSPALASNNVPQPPTAVLNHLGDRFLPKPAGTKEDLKFFFGPYVVPPGHDANRIDVQLPLMTGYIRSIEPGMRRVLDLTEPSHQEAHIHHAHWFALDPGNEEDNYTYGNTEWVFGNGDEETRADFQARSAADPAGPVYGQYVTPAAPQLMIYMLHNKTPQPLLTYIVLDVTFEHGTTQRWKRSAVARSTTSRGSFSEGPMTCPATRAGTGPTRWPRTRPGARSSGPPPSTERSSVPPGTFTQAG